MTNTPSPTELIEQAAARIAETDDMPWAECSEDSRSVYRRYARAGIESLLADRAKLEEALRTIARADYEPAPLGDFDVSYTEAAARIARAALNGSTDRG